MLYNILWLVSDKHPSLLWSFVNCDRKKFYKIGPRVLVTDRDKYAHLLLNGINYGHRSFIAYVLLVVITKLLTIVLWSLFELGYKKLP
jgi:hypothetical protein